MHVICSASIKYTRNACIVYKLKQSWKLHSGFIQIRATYHHILQRNYPQCSFFSLHLFISLLFFFVLALSLLLCVYVSFFSSSMLCKLVFMMIVFIFFVCSYSVRFWNFACNRFYFSFRNSPNKVHWNNAFDSSQCTRQLLQRTFFQFFFYLCFIFFPADSRFFCVCRNRCVKRM